MVPFTEIGEGLERRKLQESGKNPFYFGHIKFKMQERREINTNLLEGRKDRK